MNRTSLAVVGFCHLLDYLNKYFIKYFYQSQTLSSKKLNC